MNVHYASVEADILLLVYRNYLLLVIKQNSRTQNPAAGS